MSRSLREGYCVALCPDRLVAVRRKALRASIDWRFRDCWEASPETTRWGAAHSALERFAAKPEVSEGYLRVVLSNHFVRFLLIPWSDHVANVQELDNYAAAQFEQVFGEVAAGWEIRVSPQRGREARLAAAVDRSLLEAIRSAAGASRLRLKSIQPYLMSAYNRAGLSPRDCNFIFVSIEADRACVLSRAQGAWRSVSAVTPFADTAEVASLLDREIMLGGWSAERAPSVVAYCAHRPGLELLRLPDRNLRIVDIEPRKGTAPINADFAMAASAA